MAAVEALSDGRVVVVVGAAEVPQAASVSASTAAASNAARRGAALGGVRLGAGGLSRCGGKRLVART